MKILLLGAAGNLGRKTAAELLRSDDVERLTVSSRQSARANAVVRTLGGSGILTPLELDIRKRDALAAHAAEHSLVVSCAGPAGELEVQAATAALEAGTPYVSACDSATAAAALKDLDPQAVKESVCIASGLGMSPGISNLLVRHAARGFDEVGSVDISMATASSEAPGDATLMDFFTNLGARHSEDHAPTGAPRQIYFPEPVGWMEVFPCPHPEVETMQGTVSEVVRFRIGLAERVGMDLVRAAAASRMLGTPQGRRAWIAMAKPLRPVVESLPPKGAPWSALRVDVHGRTGSRTRTESLGVVDHLINLASAMLAHAALEIASGSGTPGVRAAHEVLGSASLKALTQRGIRFARLEPQAY